MQVAPFAGARIETGPSLPASWHVADHFEIFLLQNASRNARAIPAVTVGDRRTITIEFIRFFTQVRQENVFGPWNMTALPFAQRPDIDDLEFRAPLFDFMNRHLANRTQLQA